MSIQILILPDFQIYRNDYIGTKINYKFCRLYSETAKIYCVLSS